MALKAGASQVDISPADRQFLFGYPHVPRWSEGIHDPLYSSALCLSDGRTVVLFIGNDIIFVPRAVVLEARRMLEEQTGVPGDHILVSATHTHSGPVTVAYASNADDPVVPPPDPAYLDRLRDGIVRAGVEAWQRLEEAEVALAVGDSTGVGTNRRHPDGPALHEMPIVAVRSRAAKRPIGLMVVCSMHPTVLHEDSKLVSADFPGFARRDLQRVFGGCPVVHHTGPSGNQSPRYVTKGNTFEEAERLGRVVANAVQKALASASYSPATSLGAAQEMVGAVSRRLPSLEEAERRLAEAAARLDAMRRGGDARQARTAEVDWFGAQETVTLARQEQDGRLAALRAACDPVEAQVLRAGRFFFAGWPAEVFVEYGLDLKARCPGAYIISLANGELQGYLVTPEAAQEGGYEASNALFAPETAARLLEATVRLIGQL